MKARAWAWLVLLLVPGCLLVQPLDEAKPDTGGSSGNSSHAGKGNGSAGQSSAGSGATTGGSSNSAGTGAVSSAGTPSAGGGAPPIDECVAPGDSCSSSASCCQTGANVGDYGAICLSEDYFCHSICLDNTECVSGCCAELDGLSYGACVDPSYCTGA